MNMTNRATVQTGRNSNLFLTGAILLANLDFTSIEEYAIKAIIGGAVWMGFKLVGDYMNAKFKGNSNGKR